MGLLHVYIERKRYISCIKDITLHVFPIHTMDKKINDVMPSNNCNLYGGYPAKKE